MRPTSMASTRWTYSMMARVSGRGTTRPWASGQSGIASPDPVRRTIPPHTTRTKTSATVAMKKLGRRLLFAVLLLPDDGNHVEVLGRRRRGDRPLQRAGLVRMVPGVLGGRLAAPEAEQHVQHEDRHPHEEHRRAGARDVVPDRE